MCCCCCHYSAVAVVFPVNDPYQMAALFFFRLELMNKIEWARLMTIFPPEQAIFPCQLGSGARQMNHLEISHIRCWPAVPVLDIRSWAQGQDWEDSEVRVAWWWEHQCSHPAVIWYHQYRVKPSSIFCSIPIINCLPHQEEPGRIPKWIWASSDTLDLSRRLKMHPDILNKWGWRRV